MYFDLQYDDNVLILYHSLTGSDINNPHFTVHIIVDLGNGRDGFQIFLNSILYL